MYKEGITRLRKDILKGKSSSVTGVEKGKISEIFGYCSLPNFRNKDIAAFCHGATKLE